MNKYELKLPEVRHGRTIFVEPVISLKDTFSSGVILNLKIGYINDTLEFQDTTQPYGPDRVKEVTIARYAEQTMDARLSRLTPEQKQRLIEDTRIPVEELDEIAAIEKENEKMLGDLLFDQHK